MRDIDRDGGGRLNRVRDLICGGSGSGGSVWVCVCVCV